MEAQPLRPTGDSGAEEFGCETIEAWPHRT